jgi:hypothetical protein
MDRVSCPPYNQLRKPTSAVKVQRLRAKPVLRPAQITAPFQAGIIR